MPKAPSSTSSMSVWDDGRCSRTAVTACEEGLQVSLVVREIESSTLWQWPLSENWTLFVLEDSKFAFAKTKRT